MPDNPRARVGYLYYSAAHDGLVALITEINTRSVVYRILGRTGQARLTHAEFPEHWLGGHRTDPKWLYAGSVWRPIGRSARIPSSGWRFSTSRTRIVVQGTRGNQVHHRDANSAAGVDQIIEELREENTAPSGFGERPTIEAFCRQHYRTDEGERPPWEEPTSRAEARTRAIDDYDVVPETRPRKKRKKKERTTIWDRIDRDIV